MFLARPFTNASSCWSLRSCSLARTTSPKLQRACSHISQNTRPRRRRRRRQTRFADDAPSHSRVPLHRSRPTNRLVYCDNRRHCTLLRHRGKTRRTRRKLRMVADSLSWLSNVLHSRHQPHCCTSDTRPPHICSHMHDAFTAKYIVDSGSLSWALYTNTAAATAFTASSIHPYSAKTQRAPSKTLLGGRSVDTVTKFGVFCTE